MNLIFKLFKTGALISLISMIAVVAIQVFARYFLESTPHWTEEAARIFFIYSVSFGTGTGIKNGDFIRLNLIEKFMSAMTDRLLNIFTDIVVIIFSGIIIVHSVKFIKYGMDELSPALEVPMGFVFISIAMIGLSTAIFTFANLYELVKGKS